MGLQILKNYMMVTIEEVPKCSMIDEPNNSEKIMLASPIFHSWLRNDSEGVIGLKFSSWMINNGQLTKKEKDVIALWSKSETDFEIFFGKTREYNPEKSLDEVVLYTSILKLDKVQHALSFPLFGASVDKKEMALLEASLPPWKPAEIPT